jgi:hypothetical protein
MTHSRRYLKSMLGRLPKPRYGGAAFSLLLIAAFLSVSVQAAVAAPAFYGGIATDGKVAAFSTKEQMVPGDTDQELDVYVRELDEGLGEYVTLQVSLGPRGGNDTLPAQFDAISADGREVVFSTTEPLVPGDTDQRADVYLRDLFEDKTLLISQGDASCDGGGCGNGPEDAGFAPRGAAAEGGVVFFSTAEVLDDLDEDSGLDLYARDVGDGRTLLVSAGDDSCIADGCGDGGQGAAFLGTDPSGERAFFATLESLDSADADTGVDIYARDLAAETTTLISTAGTCPSDLPAGQNCEPSFGGISADGSDLFFETNERLPGGDTDSVQDVYGWSGGAPVLVSIGPDGGNGDAIVTYAGSSPDGRAVYFETAEKLVVPADADAEPDVYQRLEGATSLISAGAAGHGNGPELASFDWATLAGSTEHVVFSTREPLTGGDADLAQDLYERSAGVTTLLSVPVAGGEFDASFAGASADGAKVFFVTAEPLAAADTDLVSDVYMRSAGGTALVSAGQINGSGPFPVGGLHGVTGDGARAFFVTQERLTVDDDFAGEQDVFAWSAAGTLLVSVRNPADLVLGPPPPALEATIPASPGLSSTPTIVGQAAAGTLIKIYRTSDCSGDPVAEGTAEQLTSPGLTVKVAVAPGSTTSYRATAESEGVVSACSGPISYTQQDPPPPTGGGGGAGGGPTGGTGGGTGSTGTAAGGTGGSAAGRTHRGVSYVAPLPRITFGPAAKTRLRRPTFRFVDSTEQPGTDFFCRIDRQRWVKCTSPFKSKKLKVGRHLFSVKAVNAVGTSSESPVKRQFRVVSR